MTGLLTPTLNAESPQPPQRTISSLLEQHRILPDVVASIRRTLD